MRKSRSSLKFPLILLLGFLVVLVIYSAREHFETVQPTIVRPGDPGYTNPNSLLSRSRGSGGGASAPATFGGPMFDQSTRESPNPNTLLSGSRAPVQVGVAQDTGTFGGKDGSTRIYGSGNPSDSMSKPMGEKMPSKDDTQKTPSTYSEAVAKPPPRQTPRRENQLNGRPQPAPSAPPVSRGTTGNRAMPLASAEDQPLGLERGLPGRA
jgi:hypothetical protein